MLNHFYHLDQEQIEKLTIYQYNFRLRHIGKIVDLLSPWTKKKESKEPKIDILQRAKELGIKLPSKF